MLIQADILSSCYKVVTHNLLTNCWSAGRSQVVGTTCNKSVELNNLAASCQQAIQNLSTNLCEHTLLTCCWNSIATSLLQVCYNLCVFTGLAEGGDVYFAVIIYTRKNLAMLDPSCQQVWNKLLTTCNNLVDIIRLVARLFQQIRYGHEITILLQPCVVNLVTFLLYHDCIKLVIEQPCNNAIKFDNVKNAIKFDNAIKLVTSC
jgi:hypothetical protein